MEERYPPLEQSETMKPTTKLALALLLLSGIAAIQWHSLAFWSEYITPEAPMVGYGLSILLEAVALLFWSLRKHALAAVATLLLLTGPMAHLGMPVYTDIQEARAEQTGNPQVLELKQEQLASVRADLQTFRDNSLERTGWLPAIEEAQAKRDALMAEIAALKTAQTAHIAYEQYLPVAVYALALLLFQISNILVIRRLSMPDPDPVVAAPVPASADVIPIARAQDYRHDESRIDTRLRAARGAIDEMEA